VSWGATTGSSSRTRKGSRTRFADDRGVITFEVTTLGRTGRIDTKTVTGRCPLNHLRHPNRVLPPVDGEAAAPACMQKILLHAAFPNAGPGIAASTDLFGYWSVSGPPKKGAA
jgi:hypothetical protein